jgi:hypothetical protein
MSLIHPVPAFEQDALSGVRSGIGRRRCRLVDGVEISAEANLAMDFFCCWPSEAEGLPDRVLKR